MKMVLGIDIGGTNLRGAIIDNEGLIHERQKLKSDARLGIENLISNLVNLIDQFKGHNPLAVGIGIPGIIDSKNGLLTQAPNIKGVEDFKIYKVLQDYLGSTPFLLENDANCSAAGEYWAGVGKGSNSIIMLTLGTGLGGGIILNGELWQGEDGMAGEIGHMVLKPDGPECNCGSQGCFESFASAEAVRRIVKNSSSLTEKTAGIEPDNIPERIMELATIGDEESINIWKDIGMYIGIGITSLVNLLNVDSIIIGGGLSNAWELFIDSAEAEVEKRALQGPKQRLKILRAGLGDDAGTIGAAYLAMKTLNMLD